MASTGTGSSVASRSRRTWRRRRKAALPIQTGLVMFACVMLAAVALLNGRLASDEFDEFGAPRSIFDFRVWSSRRLQDSGSGGQLRWENPFSTDQMRRGAVILHIGLMIYMFAGLAIVCDDFFCSALDEICIKLDISDDVAGATFMAAGGSAPEFFTSLLGVFFFESDVGFGTIVGSAVFNVLFVIGLCAYFSGFDTLPLTWYPLARDSSYYLLCLSTLLAVSSDREITWTDSLILCLLYIGYVTIMFFDPPIRKWCMKNLDRTGTRQVTPAEGAAAKADGKEVEEGKEGGEESKEEEEEEAHDGPPEWPEGTKERLIYIINAPLNWGFYLTIPNCKIERFKKWYMLTFWMSVFWIGALSYVMLVMAEDIGITVDLPTNVMGVTILAIGTSVPDAVSSLLVARDGHGDMALSSSIGSNVFDVTFGLPVPWLIKTAFIEFNTGKPITIEAKGMSIQVGTLMFMVFAVVFSIHVFGWKISRPLGLFYFGLYFVFVTLAVVISQCPGGGQGIDGCP